MKLFKEPQLREGGKCPYCIKRKPKTGIVGHMHFVKNTVIAGYNYPVLLCTQCGFKARQEHPDGKAKVGK